VAVEARTPITSRAALSAAAFTEPATSITESCRSMKLAASIGNSTNNAVTGFLAPVPLYVKVSPTAEEIR